MIEVRLEDQVVDYLRKCSPQPRRAIRGGLRALQHEKGDIKALTGELEGFYRLRIGKFRLIFWYQTKGTHRWIECLYIAERSWVYEVFQSRIYTD